ncbi:MAG: PaaI family thioesterase [Alphaproteobacteria bacterium]|nr:PaaI family thioesterase [Alphaproteobacteria bacterium]MBU0797743.1 PaaI family thioesterase [Alphaproteobacteria bacterium]MBU0887096.1 PaaI family thioesterase [Alphaproteobacteria bacterium]MBU1814346.1 PaaI family thioesterase [Alphaproteobacteria bacterium]
MTMNETDIQAIFDGSPFIAFLQLQVISLDTATQELKVRAPMRPELQREPEGGQWHGGPIAAVIDTVGDFALAYLVGKPLPTVNFRVDYLRPAMNTDLIAVAKVRRNGKSVGIADVDVFNEAGVLVAIGRATYSTL